MRFEEGYRRRGRLRARGRQILSLLQVVALAVTTLALLPLVVRADTDPFATLDGPGETAFRCDFGSGEVFVTATRSCRMRVVNGGPVDASFFLFVEPASIRVTRCPDQGAPGPDGDFAIGGECAKGAARLDVGRGDPRFDRFVGKWAMSVQEPPVMTSSTEHDVGSEPHPVEICAPRGLDAYDGGYTARMCSLGVMRGFQTAGAIAGSEEPAYERTYLVAMTNRDDGTDQRFSRGWDLHFDMVVRAIVPATAT